ncbi:MAG: alpha/beta fold hydrolase, partial [Chloroflexota bacterium]|nr:alpha/beta fold hydrolase [Chloroflexota bacterium]
MARTHQSRQSPLLDLSAIRPIYPFVQRWLDLPHGRMHYLDEGQGPPVIMLHGNPTWSFYYRRLISALRERHRVIVPDHLGCGLSDKPQDYAYRLTDHIDNLGQLVRHLGLAQADLVLHDWGGAIGMGLAVQRALHVRRIVVLNTAAFLARHVPLRIAVCKLPIVGDIAIRGLNAFAGMATRMAVERPLEPLVRQGYLLPYR